MPFDRFDGLSQYSKIGVESKCCEFHEYTLMSGPESDQKQSVKSLKCRYSERYRDHAARAAAAQAGPGTGLGSGLRVFSGRILVSGRDPNCTGKQDLGQQTICWARGGSEPTSTKWLSGLAVVGRFAAQGPEAPVLPAHSGPAGRRIRSGRIRPGLGCSRPDI